jgi:hypothetical protein
VLVRPPHLCFTRPSRLLVLPQLVQTLLPGEPGQIGILKQAKAGVRVVDTSNGVAVVGAEQRACYPHNRRLRIVTLALVACC